MENRVMWRYLFATREEIPASLSGKQLSWIDEYPELRLGIYCQSESHKQKPWLLGSFSPAWELLVQRGERRFNFEGVWATGDRTMFRLAGAESQLISAGQRVPVDDKNRTRLTTESQHRGYGRTVFNCNECGLRRVFRDENLQSPVMKLLENGIRELDLSTFIEAVDRASA